MNQASGMCSLSCPGFGSGFFVRHLESRRAKGLSGKGCSGKRYSGKGFRGNTQGSRKFGPGRKLGAPATGDREPHLWGRQPRSRRQPGGGADESSRTSQGRLRTRFGWSSLGATPALPAP